MSASPWHGLMGQAPAYAAGASGTVTVPSGGILIKVWCHSTAGGTLTIFGGASIPIIGGAAPFELDNKHANFAASGSGSNAQIVFTGTDSYFVHWVLPVYNR